MSLVPDTVSTNGVDPVPAPVPALQKVPTAEEVRRAFESGKYPYPRKMGRRVYERTKAELQAELLKVQLWSQETGQKFALIFEGRDAAGKGGTIKRFTEHLNPRAARVVALNKPTWEEKGQWYFQRYVQELPTVGEMVFYDRSWYNRAGVERVMGFCSPNDYLEFMRQTPLLEQMLVRSDIRLYKYWFSVTQREQKARFDSRSTDPLKRWKLSPIDRQGFPRQMGRLHRSQRGDVLLHRHGGCPVDRDQIQLQETRPAELHAPFSVHNRLPGQEPRDCRHPRSAHRGSGPSRDPAL